MACVSLSLLPKKVIRGNVKALTLWGSSRKQQIAAAVNVQSACVLGRDEAEVWGAQRWGPGLCVCWRIVAHILHGPSLSSPEVRGEHLHQDTINPDYLGEWKGVSKKQRYIRYHWPVAPWCCMSQLRPCPARCPCGGNQLLSGSKDAIQDSGAELILYSLLYLVLMGFISYNRQWGNRTGKGTVWGLGLGEGQGLSVEENPIILHVFMQTGQHRARSHCHPNSSSWAS